jgi:hypothetical protein
MALFLPKKSVVCTTIETNQWIGDVMCNCLSPANRAIEMQRISELGIKTYVTIEPIMKFNLDGLVELIAQCNPEQVNIGADSGGNNLPEPTAKEIQALIIELSRFTKVHKKSNLKRLMQ